MNAAQSSCNSRHVKSWGRHKNSDIFLLSSIWTKSEKILKKGLFIMQRSVFSRKKHKKHPILRYWWDVMIDVDSWLERPAQCLWYHFHVVKAMQTLYGRQVELLLVCCCKMEKCPSNVQAQGGRVLFKTLEGFQSLSCISSEWTHSPTGSGKMAFFGLWTWYSSTGLYSITLNNNTPPKTSITMEKQPFLIGDTSSNGFSSIVMLFSGVYTHILILVLIFSRSYELRLPWT